MKTHVYSWRLSGELKSQLERAARAWLAQNSAELAEDGDAQRRLHAAAERCFGTIAGFGRITLNECAKQYADDSRKNMAAGATPGTTSAKLSCVSCECRCLAPKQCSPNSSTLPAQTEGPWRQLRNS